MTLLNSIIKNYLQKRSRLLLLIGVMVVVSLLIVSTAIYLLYIATFEVTRERLVDTVKSQSRMMEAVAEFDAIYSTDYPGGSKAATLSQIINASEHFQGLGETGEFVLAERKDEKIVFLLHLKHSGVKQRKPISFGSELAQPMRLALQGKSGSIVGLDYRGKRVLAAYEPVGNLGYGIVAKMDLSEVRAPFIRAGFITFGIMLFLVTLGAIIFYRITNPILTELQKSKDSLIKTNRALGERAEKLSQYEHIVSNSVDMMALLDKSYRYLTANSSYLEAFKKNPDELIGSTVADVFGNEYFEEILKPNADRCLKGEVVNYQAWIEFPTKGLKYMDTTYSPYADADNNVLGFVVNARDITERKQAADALEEANSSLQSNIDQMPIAYIIFGLDFEIQMWNPAAEKIFGFSKDEAIGQDLFDLIVPRNIKSIVKDAVRPLLNGEPASYSESDNNIRKDGKIISCQWHNTPIKDSAGKVNAVQCMVTDITERMHNEEALKEKTAALEESQRVASLGSYELEISTGIWSSSDVLDEIFGIGKDYERDVNGWAEIIHPDERKEMQDYFSNHILAEHQSFNKEYRIIRSNDHEERWVHGLGKLEFDKSDEPIRMIGTIQDITERKQSEEALIHSRDQLRELSLRLESIREEERTEIARDIHDDLGQSLTALKLDISSIKNNTKDNDLINKAVSMLALVDSTIKTVQKVAARLRPGILDDLGLISAMEWQLEEFQTRTGIKCKFKHDDIDMTHDSERSTTLFRIFQELLTNIVRHAKATKVMVRLSVNDEILTLNVRDDGIGISEKNKKDSKSYGIMGINERLIPWNGKFEITGKKGKGTIATVTLPLNIENDK